MGIKKSIDGDAVIIAVTGHADVRVSLAGLHADIVTRAALHGLSQKLGDAGALSAGASDAERYEAIRAVADHLEQAACGEDWNRKATGDGSGGDGLLVRALVELGGERDAVKAKVAAMDKKTQAAVRALPQVADIIARMKAPKNPAIGANALAALLGTAPVKDDTAPF